MLGEFIRVMRVVSLLSLLAFGTFHCASSEAGEHRNVTPLAAYSRLDAADIDAAIPELLSISTGGKGENCPGLTAKENKEKPIQREDNETLFTEKGWREYKKFVTDEKRKLGKKGGEIALAAVKDKNFLDKKNQRITYHLYVSLNSSACFSETTRNYDLFLALKKIKTQNRVQAKIDGWTAKASSKGLHLTVTY